MSPNESNDIINENTINHKKQKAKSIDDQKNYLYNENNNINKKKHNYKDNNINLDKNTEIKQIGTIESGQRKINNKIPPSFLGYNNKQNYNKNIALYNNLSNNTTKNI